MPPTKLPAANLPLPRTFLRRIATFTLIAVAVGMSVSSTECAYSLEKPSAPNIVFLLADDLGYGDLGCYGQKLIRTPNVDRLAAQGMRFTQAYAGSTVCAASRGVLMTGLHNGHSPVRDNVPHFATYLQQEDVTLAEVLQQAGYRCGGVGKWSLGDAGTVGRATNQGFDKWFGYLNQDHAHHYFTEYLDDDEGRFSLEGNSESRQHYSHHLLTERALKFIRQSRHAPFFLYVAYTLPHFSAKEEDEHGLAVPSTAPYDDKDWDAKSKKYATMVHLLDEGVGQIVRLIDELELAEDTLIIFTSDNGGHSGVPKRFNTNGPLRGYKRDLTEGGIRVPFIARWKGTTPAHEVSDAVVGFQDMLPTFAELAGAKTPENIDGISIASVFQGQPLENPHEFLYWDYGHCRPRYDQAVRWHHWKGLRLGQKAEVQLFDLSTDLGEKHNVAAKHPEVVKQIAEIMRTAPGPSDRYPIGQIYRGKPIWTVEKARSSR